MGDSIQSRQGCPHHYLHSLPREESISSCEGQRKISDAEIGTRDLGHNNCRSDSGVLASIEEVSLAGWRKAVEKCHLDVNFYAHQRWDTSEKLPWAILDLGTEPGHLEVELNKALSQTILTS
jgi:hypothetical protein